MVVRNRPRKQQRARVVPVVLRLDDFRTVLGYELSEVNLDFTLGSRQISLLDILIMRSSRLGRVDPLGRVAKADIRSKAQEIPRPRFLFNRQFGIVEAELVMVEIEVAVYVLAAAWLVEVVPLNTHQ